MYVTEPLCDQTPDIHLIKVLSVPQKDMLLPFVVTSKMRVIDQLCLSHTGMAEGVNGRRLLSPPLVSVMIFWLINRRFRAAYQ